MRNLRTGPVAVVAAAVIQFATLGACDFGPDGDPDVLAVVGANATEQPMGVLVGHHNADSQYNEDPEIPGVDRDALYNVLADQRTPKTVPGDEHCDTRTYHRPVEPGEYASPNGSEAGLASLRASVVANDGCIDVVRVTHGPRPVSLVYDLPTYQYYAFGLEAVGYSTASTAAPAGGLTHAQLQGIYNCTFTNWNQVGGVNQPIQRYWPPPGSETRSFFQTDVLGFDPTVFSGPGCPLVRTAAENQGLTVRANSDQQAGIQPFSAAAWVAMARGTIPDERSGQVIGNVNGQNIVFGSGGGAQPATPAATGVPNAPVQEANVKLLDPTPAYPGIRFVFNVIDSTSASHTSAIRYVGFENEPDGLTSPLCSGRHASLLGQYGFATLTNAESVRNLAGSRCRVYYPQ